jgi:hypothetical protein
MASEVRHGLTPKWSRRACPIGRQHYRAEIAGHYTVTSRAPNGNGGLAAVGVRQVKWVSARPVKRQGELLAMRSAFLCWFVRQYMRNGGTYRQAVKEVRGYPFARILRRGRSMGWPEGA